MKFGAASLLIASTCVSGTAAFSAGYLGSLGDANGAAAAAPKRDYSPTHWSPTGAKRESPSAGSAILETTMSNPRTNGEASTIDLTNFLRQEYNAWLEHHGKASDETRFKIFKDNYIRQWQTDRVTGEYHFLNEYGDMTTEEFAQLTGAAVPAAPEPVAPPPPPAAPAAPEIQKAASLQESFRGAFARPFQSHLPYIERGEDASTDYPVFKLNKN